MQYLIIITTVLALLWGCQSTPPSGSSGSPPTGPSLPLPTGSDTGDSENNGAEDSSTDTLPEGSEGSENSEAESSPGSTGPSESTGRGLDSTDLPGSQGGRTLDNLDTTFDKSLDEFDDTLQGAETTSTTGSTEDVDILYPSGQKSAQEFEDLYEDETATSQSASGGGNPSPTGDSGPPSPPASDSPASSTSDSKPSGGKPADQEEPPPLPPDIGDGRGDDIVARQMREAAMKESDPELREKLWEEYRKYRDGGR